MKENESESHIRLCDPDGLECTRLLCPRDFPGKNPGVVTAIYFSRYQTHVPCIKITSRTSPGGSAVKKAPASAGQAGDAGLIPGSGRSSGDGNGNPLRYYSLENPMDGGALWLQSMGSQRVRRDWVTE